MIMSVVPVKSNVKISQNFVAFSEYMNFNCSILEPSYTIVCPCFFLPQKSYLEAKIESFINFVCFNFLVRALKTLLLFF